ncbi:MFS family permease [Microbacterium sp. SORGH_AS 888]|nr:MFS family permease [Microbacterium sp. SORGH_AS_0888]
MFLAVSRLPDEQFLAWGWRIPFLFSAVLVVVALLIRLSLEETETFVAMKRAKLVAKAPILDVFRIAPVAVFLGIGASAMGIAIAYFTNTFALAWTTTSLDVPRPIMLNVLLVIAILQFLVQPIAAFVGHKVGMTRVMVVALGLGLVTTLPTYLLIATANPVWIAVGLALSTLFGAAYFALLAGFLASAFPPQVRYSGLSISYQLSATVVGGATPLIAQSLLAAFGGAVWGVAAYQSLLILITLVCVVALSAHIRRHESELTNTISVVRGHDEGADLTTRGSDA